jgi:hypothetical protein
VSLPEGAAVARAMTGATGAYSVIDLAARSYSLTATAPNYARQVRLISPGPGEVVTCDFALDTTVGRLRGLVQDQTTGLPVPGLAVMLFSPTGGLLASAVTGIDGGYLFEALAPGAVWVYLPPSPAYIGFLEAADIVAGETARVDAALAPGLEACSWPTDEEWLALIDPTCAGLRALSANVTPLWLDLTSAGRTGQYGLYNTGFLAYRTATNTLYFRVLISAFPLTPGGLEPGQWGVLLDLNGDGWAEWVALVTSLLPGAPLLRVMYCPVGRRDNIPREETWSAPADPAAGYLRVLPGPVSPDGLQTFYLDWQTPFPAYQSAAPDAPPPVGPKSCVRFFAATGDSDGLFNKDFIAGRSVDFSLVQNLPLDGVPYGRIGRLADIRDPDPPSDLGQWRPGETLVITGTGWCRQASSLNLRVLDPAGTEVCRETAPLEAGRLPPAAIWTIPDGARPGIYGLEVGTPLEDPSVVTGWQTHDRFTVPHLPPEVTLLAPAGGERWTGSRTIAWTASSPQGFALVYDVEVSPDGGASWSGTLLQARPLPSTWPGSSPGMGSRRLPPSPGPLSPSPIRPR